MHTKRRKIPRQRKSSRKGKDPRQLDAFIRNYENACTCVRIAARSRSRSSWKRSGDEEGKKKRGKKRSVIRRGEEESPPMRKRVDDWNIKRTARVIRFRTIEFRQTLAAARQISRKISLERQKRVAGNKILPDFSNLVHGITAPYCVNGVLPSNCVPGL